MAHSLDQGRYRGGIHELVPGGQHTTESINGQLQVALGVVQLLDVGDGSGSGLTLEIASKMTRTPAA